MKRLWKNSLLHKLFLSYLTIIALLFGCFYFYSGTVLDNLQVASLGRRLEREARLLNETLPWDTTGGSLDEELARLGKAFGTRITVIGPEGQVLGDSDGSSEAMENHRGRPEVAEALSRGSASSIRYSTTIKQDLVYQAVLTEGPRGKRVIRLAVPHEQISRNQFALAPEVYMSLLAVSAIALLLAYLAFYYLRHRLQRLIDFSRQAASGSFPHNFFSARSGDEIDVIGSNLNEMSARLRDTIQQITAEKEKADSILRCMVESVVVLDPKGRVLLLNAQARKLFQVAPGRDIYGLSVAELSRHPAMLRTMHDALEFDFEAGGYSKEVEIEENQWFQVNAVTLTDGDHEVHGSILVFHDISEIKRLETVRSDFVANVSHELRTPLTAIRGYVETLLQMPPEDPADARHFLTVIERHAARLGRLTEDLLTLSDLEFGRLPLARRPVGAAQLAQRVLEVFWEQAKKKNLRLCSQIEPGLPPLLGDFDRLQQLFINLVDNAVKYTPTGGTVTISAARAGAAEGRSMALFTVSDTGAGIPEKDIPRLTERFYRVDKARSRELGGTGLGLAIVKHIVQAHRGRLTIESTLKKGTTISVTLPASEPESARRNVLFLCTANSCRSQMAEGFARRLAAPGEAVYSAGTAPGSVHPMAVQVMSEAGIDISGQRSKSVNEIPLDQVDLLITLCGDAAESCPALPINARRQHWPVPDPARATGSEEKILDAFRDARDAIQRRILELYGATRPPAP